MPDILTDSVAEFDSRDYEHQQFDDLRNVHVWTSVHIVESSLPLSRWEHFACRFSLRYPVIEVPAVRLTRLQLHHAAAAFAPSSDEKSGEVLRGSYMREMPQTAK